MTTPTNQNSKFSWILVGLGTLAALGLTYLGLGRGRGGDSSKIAVYVIGEVQTPGVVVLPAGSRVVHAIERAGGLTPQADEKAINLAARLSDEEKIVVPAKGATAVSVEPRTPEMAEAPGQELPVPEPPPVEPEVAAPPEMAPPIEESTPAPADNGHWEGGLVVESEAPDTVAAQPESEAPPGRVSVNRATVEELEGVPGVGPDLAAKIVAFRQGPPARAFSTLEELTQIPGIKERKLEQLRPYIDL
ncbi:MAG: helix-hairpin-helix domain-containing protein [Candidatus Eremiobacteraeota bacterium]|nr:helix-hairpin-helix domain-containing protein [Candidatus Eremiobacteraeota bacterium]